MTFKDWLDNQCEKRATRNGVKDITKFKFERLKLNNGKSMSVQASAYHACYPEETLEKNEYETVEVYTGDPDLEDRLVFYERSKHTYGNVPIQLMEDICKKNGGIVNG